MKLTLAIILLTFGCFLSRALTMAEGVVEGFEGGAVVLPCTVSIQGDVRWKVKTTLVLIRLANGSALPPENSPWKDVVSFVGSSNNLSISSLSHQRDDNFAFRCEDFQDGRGQNTTVGVLAKITGASIEDAIAGQVTVTEGENITLTCALTGNPNPAPSYSWRVDNGSVTKQGSNYSLTANRLMRSISCTATNTYSNGSVLSTAEATATLNVLYLDTPSTVTLVNVTENEATTLPCSARGNPLPTTFEWRRSGSAKVMSTSANYSIENVQRSAAGEYTCNITNSVGSRQTRVTLVVQYPPVVRVTYDQSTHTLTCTAEGVPDTYTFSPWEQRLGGTLIRTLETNTALATLLLNDTLTYADTGDYVCSVTNGIKSPQTGLIHVAPPTPAIFQKRSERVTIGLGKTQAISVPFYVRPSSGSVQVRWEKAGETNALQSHQEEPGVVSLVVYGQPVSLQGNVTTLTLTNVRQADEGNYSVTVTSDISGGPRVSQTRFYVSVTEISEKHRAGIAPIAGGVAGGVVLIAVIVLVIVVLLNRRSGGASRAGGKDEKTSVNEQLVDNSEKSAFSDPRWKERDAEVADNEMYEGTSFSGKLPPQDKRPPKPVRTFEHNSIHEPSHSTAPKDGGREMEMAENAMKASADPKTKAQKNLATKPEKGKPGVAAKPAKTAKTQLPIDDSYEPTDFSITGANNNNPPPPQRRKVNYQEVAFDKTKKPPKSHPRESPTEYADIKFSQRQ